MPREERSEHLVTATGIRIVGRAAAELVKQSAGSLFEVPSPADVIWVGRFKARPRLGTGSPVPGILQTVGD